MNLPGCDRFSQGGTVANILSRVLLNCAKGSGDEAAAVIFLKHNVIDEYDEQSDIAERLRIKRIKATIEKYTTPAPAASQDA
ncbi:hypothetical protein Hanom_Chr01g00041131 [Helianthus anomalus]